MADALREQGARVDVGPAAAIADLGPYDAVVLGTPLYDMTVLPEAAAFLERHATALRRLPVAEFTLSMTMAGGGEEQRRRVLGALAPLNARSGVEPVDIGLFGGVIERRRLGFMDRLLATLRRQPDYDHRDWQAIRAWATGLAPRLLGTRTASVARPTAGAGAPTTD